MEGVLEHFRGDFIVCWALFQSESEDGDLVADGFKALFGFGGRGVVGVDGVDVD